MKKDGEEKDFNACKVAIAILIVLTLLLLAYRYNIRHALPPIG